MLLQSACVIVACYYGWGTSIQNVPDASLRIAEIVRASDTESADSMKPA